MFEYNSYPLTGDASKYIAIPASIILNTNLDTMRVALFSFFMFRRGLDNNLFFSINSIVRWFNRKPNRNKGCINDKIYHLIYDFKNIGFLTFVSKELVKPKKRTTTPFWEQFTEVSFDTIGVAIENNKERFAVIYLDELKLLLNYEGNKKDVYLNSFSLILVFAYLRMMIVKRNNKYKSNDEMLNMQNGFPEAYNDFYKDIANDIGISPRTLGKIVNVLQDLNLIRYENLGKTKYIDNSGKVKYKTDHTIFSNAYKRERNYLLTDSDSYSKNEIYKKKIKLGYFDQKGGK